MRPSALAHNTLALPKCQATQWVDVILIWSEGGAVLQQLQGLKRPLTFWSIAQALDLAYRFAINQVIYKKAK
ncbi:MAG TPA: hypothetical protein DGZ24_07640 [Rhodospirillaceae bacterium]|nr:hypothetical protein [Candidatus Neomarinimicrobiota bacterium]HCX15172.1 hypothetical protein [Rhodospirillaceae bacterium]